MPAFDRRCSSRIDTRWPCRIHHAEEGFIKGMVTNASPTDALITSGRQLPLGDLIQLEIEHRESEWLHGIGRICRVDPASRNQWNHVIRYVRIDEESASVLRNYTEPYEPVRAAS